MTTWFTSDTHFGHANILNYCPWRKTWARNVEEMDRVLISLWNDTVAPDDVVYHLGDFSFGNENQITDLVKQLNGKIRIALGNHDRSAASMRRCGFVEVAHHLVLDVDHDAIYMTHDPMRFHPREVSEATMLLHGHRHGEDHHPIPEAGRDRLLDIGIDAVRCASPLSLDQVRKLFHERHHA